VLLKYIWIHLRNWIHSRKRLCRIWPSECSSG